MITPSWKISVHSGEIDPGRSPPISAKCAQLWEKASSAPSAKTGERNT